MNKTIINEENKEINWDAAVNLMDNEIQEAVHLDLAPCINEIFWIEYCKRHREVFGEEFEPNKANPVW